MKRNKRTEKVGPLGLSPLTERILAKMGAEGGRIQRRLQTFYQERACSGEGGIRITCPGKGRKAP